MEPNKLNKIKDRWSDIYLEYKWPFLLVGFGQSESLAYSAYTLLLIGLNTYMQTAAGYATVLVNRKDQVINALHGIAGSLFCTWSLASKIITHRSMVYIRTKTNYGIYHYEDENEEAVEIKMKEEIWEEVKKKINTIGLMYILGFFSNMIFFPLSQYFILEDKEESVVNPYLPHVFYSPFETRSLLGYSSAYIIDFIFWMNIYTTSVVVNAVYISYTAQLKADLRFLNYSLKNIHRRALFKYSRNVNPTKVSQEDAAARKEFQNCLYLCLKANVKHHQAILRFKEKGQAFVGSILLTVFVLASFIYATILYCIFQNPPVNVLINYALTSVAEQTFTLFICFFGEEVLGESKQLFETLYNTSWYNYDEKFKKSLHIMMCNTKKPIEVKAMLLNITSSLQSYGEILSTMYKLMNLTRHSDTV